MYAEFYGLREPPFNVTPDPRFLYLNDNYQEALAALAYGIDARKGFISLVGEAGTGKTTLLRRLLDTVAPGTRTVLLLNPTVSFEEILEHILLELGVPPDGGRKLVLLQRLNDFLLEHTRAGGNVALLIDEAQDLQPSVLEELRLLSNLETAREKILQIVLAGQPELDGILADPRLRQLRQRVTLRIRLRTLTAFEVGAYVRSRLEKAGSGAAEIFTADALARVSTLSEGIPRLVNVLCDASLLAGFAAGSRQVTPPLVDEAWRDFAIDLPAAPPAPSVAAAPAPTAPPPPILASPPPVVTAPPPAPAEPAPAAAFTLPAFVSPPPEARAQRPAAPAEPPRVSRYTQAGARARSAAPPPAPRAPLGIPVAAAVVALLAVGLSLLSLRQDQLVGDSDDLTFAAAGPQIAGAVDATAAEPPPAPVEPAAQPRATGAGPVSPTEAAALIDEFRAAYEARDVDRLLALFAPDASENGHRGVDAIASAYRASLPAMTDVRYSMPRFSVEPRGTGAGVRGPFVISYFRSNGAAGEIRGQAEWSLERRDGRARIVALDYRLDPAS